MEFVLIMLAVQGVIGAFDTVYYHEWRARLPAGGRTAAPELRIHAVRDFLYAVIFTTLPWFSWQGAWAFVLGVILLSEIVLTLWDFVIEKIARKELGDVFAGERVTHAVMGIIYGAMLAHLIPTLIEWAGQPTAFVRSPAPVPETLRIALTLMGVGVLLSGLRDLYASFGLPAGNWPWGDEERETEGP